MDGMCAYLIKENDKEIHEPIARIAIKRLIGQTQRSVFIFVSEDRIYGDELFSKELEFDKQVINILEKSNKLTSKQEIIFQRNDDRSYSDSNLNIIMNLQDKSREEIQKYFDKIKSRPHLIKKIQWDDISKLPELSMDFIEIFKDYLNFNLICQYQKLDENFIERFKNNINFDTLSRTQVLSESFIEKYKDKLNWDYIIEFQKLSEPFIEKMLDYISWRNLAKYQKLSSNFIEKYKDKLPINDLIIAHAVPLSFIEAYPKKDDIKWLNLVRNYQNEIDEEFVQKYEKYFDWNAISRFCTLTEDFIRRFHDKVDWEYICTHQVLSESFVDEFADKVDWKEIFYYQSFSKNFKEKWKHKIYEL